MRLIDEEFLRHPSYGSRKMKVYLNRKGIPVNRKQIQRLMRLMGLESIAPSISSEFVTFSYLILRFFNSCSISLSE
jgi:hypothetical protein